MYTRMRYWTLERSREGDITRLAEKEHPHFSSVPDWDVVGDIPWKYCFCDGTLRLCPERVPGGFSSVDATYLVCCRPRGIQSKGKANDYVPVPCATNPKSLPKRKYLLCTKKEGVMASPRAEPELTGGTEWRLGLAGNDPGDERSRRKALQRPHRGGFSK
jgi:hypothetical protein